MLAKFPNRSLFAWVCLACVGSGAILCQAQQPPSTRYQPAVGYRFTDDSTPQETAPPSVHIPPTNTQLLPPSQGAPGNRHANSGNDQWRNSTTPHRSMVRQTSFQQDSANSGQEPTVPEILAQARGGQSNVQNPRGSFQPPRSLPGSNGSSAPLPLNTADLARELGRPPASTGSPTQQAQSTTSPSDFSNQMSQLRQSPKAESQELDRIEQMKKDLDLIRQRAAQGTGSSSLQPTSEKMVPSPSEPSSSEPARFAGVLPAPVSNSSPSAAPNFKSGTMELDVPQGSAAETNISARLQQPLSERDQNSMASEISSAPRESIRDFLGSKPNEAAPQVMSAPSGADDAQVQLVGMDSASGEANQLPTPIRTQDEQDAKNSAIRLTAPAISVESFGPQTIGINKPAVFKVVATNLTNQTAERVMVSIDVPSWVEIDKVNMTAGEQRASDEKTQKRLNWRLEQIPANGSQTLTITAIPRKAEPFDLGIEWTIAPRAGTANIQVTQPKLEMSIVGPDEVHFGETVPYNVTLRNVGNGDAENVVVILSESLNGERGTLGDIPAGGVSNFVVNLVARTPGQLDLGVTAVSDNQAETTTTRKLVIRRANLNISIAGPSLRYAGTTGHYVIKVENKGDAPADEVLAALGLPTGVKFLSGIETFKIIDGGLRWQIGRLEPGQAREYKIACQLESSGDIQLEVGMQAKGGLQAANACVTKVQTIADLVMQVNDPAGPLTTGEEITYELVVQNRGTKAAKGVDIFMILSEGMEPKSGSGLEYRIPRDGALQFATIPQIDPGQKMVLKVNAVAYKPGTHVFRAHLVCDEADAREIKEGTSKFFGDEVHNPMGNTADENSNFKNSDFQKKLN